MGTDLPDVRKRQLPRATASPGSQVTPTFWSEAESFVHGSAQALNACKEDSDQKEGISNKLAENTATELTNSIL